MHHIEYNPYRVVGVLATSSAKDFQRQKSKITAYLKAGKEIVCEYDFHFLPKIIRDERIINAAFAQLEQNSDKLAHAIFWFVNANHFDAIALEHLKQGNTQKAIDIWAKVALKSTISSTNFSAINNLSTLYLANNLTYKKGISLKIKLIASAYFADFIKIVADSTLVCDPQNQLEQFIDAIIADNKALKAIEIKNLFRNTSVLDLVVKKLAYIPIKNIEREIEQVQSKHSKNEVSAWAYERGITLYNRVLKDLKTLQSLLSPDDLSYQMLSDSIATELKSLSIVYYNYHHRQGSDGDHLAKAMVLLKMAQSLVATDLVKNEIDNAITQLEDLREKELNQAIELLTSIKNLYQDNKERILEQVRLAQRAMPSDQQINWSKVEEMIANSLNWQKVVQAIKTTIPRKNIEAISSSTNKNKVGQYQQLVDFLLSKIDPLQINEITYLCYWKDTLSIQKARAQAENNGAINADNATNGCLTEIVSKIIFFILLIVLFRIITGR